MADMQQLEFDFGTDLPETYLGVPCIGGWPLLNAGKHNRDGYHSGWIHRRLYPSADEAIKDAITASKYLGNLRGLYVWEYRYHFAFPDEYDGETFFNISEDLPPHDCWYCIVSNGVVTYSHTPRS